MPSAHQSGFSTQLNKHFLLFSLLCWSVLVGSSLSWNIFQLNNQVQYQATEEARANWNKDQAFRRWATRHGGVYVKPDARTPPNQYLAHLPKRDVTTTDGTQLTLMNPAYMMRQMTQEFEEMYGVKGSITGQILLNPINKADPWELQALKQFDKGATEVIDTSDINGAPYLRLIRPIIMVEGCIECHGQLGFKAGDIGGGVSVSIPLMPYQAIANETIHMVSFTHAGIWLLGLIAIAYVIQRSKRFEAERQRHEQAIKDIATGVSTATGDSFFQQLVEHIATIFHADYAFIGMLNKSNDKIVNTLAVYADGNIVDNIEYRLEGTPCYNVVNESVCAYKKDVQQRFPKDKLLKQMNAQSYIGKALRNSRGEPLGILVVLDSKPLQNTREMSELLDIFAARASGEIARLVAEQALRRNQKMDAIGQLSGGLAHDFNNQLGIIIGYLDFLKDHVEGEEKPDKWVDTATNAALHCTDLTRQLLSFSRASSHAKTVIDINTALTELQTMFARSITPAIEIEYFLSDKLWLTEIDPGEFQDAILNIIINARDAMPNGGKLIIETSNKFMDTEAIAINPQSESGEYVQIMISDNGCGMDKNILEHIFEPFYTTKEKGKGTGLGMSMVYGFAKRFGGFIKIYSEVNIGTTLRLYLPRSDATKTSTQQTAPDEKPPRGNETILIVDDEVDLLHLADNYLTDLGYKTYLAENAQQALDVLARHKDIDLVFSDIVMPGGMNGYELAQQISRQRPELKVLLTSGFTSKAVIKDDQLRFSAQMLNKPYRKITLAKRIRLVLNKDYLQ